jgi:1-phosphatidylinositol phosphodiesterase
VNNNWWIGGKDLTGAQARYLMATTDGKYVIYGKDDNHFEIRKNDTYTDWMSNIDGNRLLSEISMPGTHDSGTYKLHKDSITDTYAVTQDFSILTQLNSGVRVLDIRLGYTDGTLKVFHGSENTHLNFDEVLSQTFDFLNKHPRETVVMLIKHEHDGDIRDHFIDILKSKDSSLNRYWLENRLPNLDEVRNRIVFINRNNDINEGIKISWGDDNIFDSNEGVAFHVQDHYQLNADNTENFKIDKFNDVLNDAINGPENIWYINYLSATYVPIKSLKEIAGQINPKALDKLQNGHPNGRVGSIIMDYVGEKDTPDIIKNVIMRN